MSPKVQRVPPPCHERALEILLQAIRDKLVLAASIDLRAGGDARIAIELHDQRREPLELPGVEEEEDERG